MATTNEFQRQPPLLQHQRSESPTSDASPTPALGIVPDLSRCVSTTSSMSFSSGTDTSPRESLGSDYVPRTASAGSHPHRRSTDGRIQGRVRQRGYMRPQVTDFAVSAKSRESVMSLGSIAHLQYYFARTGLLDGKGGQLARKKKLALGTLDMSSLEGSGADFDSSYASMVSSPDFIGQNGGLVESPTEDHDDSFEDSFAESESGMLPPTVSTYHHREKTIPKPPTMEELKAELETTLVVASHALDEVKERKAGTFVERSDAPTYVNMPEENTQGWYELEGMHILDVVTLAIRAAKMYYTAHDVPDRLDAIRSEKQIRTDLLAVMEVLKQMATRNFRGGMKTEETNTMRDWADSVADILKKEVEIEAATQAERAGWTWLDGDWVGRETERERAFLVSMEPEADSLPGWKAVGNTEAYPTPFLQALQNGVWLIKLHNAVLKKTQRRYGAIPTFHTDTQKPYRCAENIRYWVKAAELRFELKLKFDVMGVVSNSGPQAWVDFEAAILKWSRHVREEVTKDLSSL